jgi:hypothetical protein
LRSRNVNRRSKWDTSGGPSNAIFRMLMKFAPAQIHTELSDAISV